MTKLRAFWRVARFGALGLAVAVVIGLVAQPAEARWRWNGYNYVWVEAPYYAPGYYPPAYYYPPAPAYYPSTPYYPHRSCWDPYYRRYYAC